MWQTLASRTAYQNQWICVREDEVTRPDGSPGVYGVVEMRHPAVFIVALDNEDRVLLVRIDRYTTGSTSLEVPAGATDGQDPLAAARRELLEETGYCAAQWGRIGRMDALNGVARAPEHVFLARDLTRVASARAEQAAEGITGVLWLPFGEVLARIASGQIIDGETIASVALAGIAIGRFA